MNPADETRFREFVVARRHRLLRTAYLLAGDPGGAEDLVEDALVRARRRWRRVVRDEDPEMYVLRALVSTYTSRRRELLARARGGAASAAGREPLPEGGREDPADDGMWEALGRLRPRTRAVLVLRRYEELSRPDVAALLGCSTTSVEGEEHRGLEALPATAREGETRLLEEQAASVPPENDPYGRTREAVRGARRRCGVTALVCVLLLAAVAVPLAVFRPFRDVPLEDWPVRGSLAGDEAFLDAARQEAIEEADSPWADGQVTYARVVYAGDLASRRHVVVVRSMRMRPRPDEGGQEAPQVESSGSREFDELVVFSGARGDEPAELDVASTALLPSGSPDSPWAAAWWSPVPHVAMVETEQDGEPALFVLGPPDTREIAYSARPEFHPDGTWDRSWRTLRARDGVTYGPLPPLETSADLVRFRLPERTVSVWVTGGADGFSPQDVPDLVVRPQNVLGRHPPGLLDAISALHFSTGLPASQFDLRTVWRDGVDRLLAATLPNGVTFQVLQRESGGFTERITVVPRGAADRPIAIMEPAVGQRPYAEESPSVVVVAPGHADGYAQLWRGSAKIATVPLDDVARGVFDNRAVTRVLRSGAELKVRVVDGSGRQVYRGPVRDEPWPPWNRPR